MQWLYLPIKATRVKDSDAGVTKVLTPDWLCINVSYSYNQNSEILPKEKCLSVSFTAVSHCFFYNLHLSFDHVNYSLLELLLNTLVFSL